MSAPAICNAATVAALDVIALLLDAGAGSGKVIIYDLNGESLPTACSDSTSWTALAEITLGDPAFGTAIGTPGSGATVSLAAGTTNETSATGGIAAFFRGLDSSDVVVIQGTCGTQSADMIMNTTEIVTGATVALTTWTITLPEFGVA